MATHHPRLVSLADAADALGVSTGTVRSYIADGQLEAVRLGRRKLRIEVDSIARFIDGRPVATGADSRFRSWRRTGSLRSNDLSGRGGDGAG